MHWEADLDRGGASVLDIRPLLWKDGWPVAGENAKEGTYEIESVDTGDIRSNSPLKECPSAAASDRRAPAARWPRPGAAGPGCPLRPAGGGGGMFAGTGSSDSASGGGTGFGELAYGRHRPADGQLLCQAQQKWTITPVSDAGGYPGSPYFKITIAGTDRALAVSATLNWCRARLHWWPGTVVASRPTCRRHLAHHAQAVPDSTHSLALSAIGSSFATLEKFDPKNDKQRWLLKTP